MSPDFKGLKQYTVYYTQDKYPGEMLFWAEDASHAHEQGTDALESEDLDWEINYVERT